MQPFVPPVDFSPLKSHFSRLVKARYSCRSFSGDPLPDKALARLNEAVTALNRITFPPLRLELFASGRLRKENIFSTGTYGMIRRPAAYLAGVTRPQGRREWLEFGRAMQTVLMLATFLDVQSCWIGGIFDRRTMGRLLNLQGDEQVPAVLALGQAAGRRTLRDRMVRRSARGNTRRPFGELFFDERWGEPLDESAHPLLTTLLENLRQAPSASNRQPWRVRVQEKDLLLYLVRTPGYQRLVPTVDLQTIDMGIALSHLEWSAREKGLDIRFGGPPPPVDAPAEPILTVSLG